MLSEEPLPEELLNSVLSSAPWILWQSQDTSPVIRNKYASICQINYYSLNARTVGCEIVMDYGRATGSFPSNDAGDLTQTIKLSNQEAMIVC